MPGVDALVDLPSRVARAWASPLGEESRLLVEMLADIVGVLLKNLGYAKEVKVHYSYDNWTNVHVANAMFQANRFLGYSNVTYPNANGVEYWSFYTNSAEAQNSTASEVQFAVSYKVNGVTYWDNNFGQNYRVTITRY